MVGVDASLSGIETGALKTVDHCLFQTSATHHRIDEAPAAMLAEAPLLSGWEFRSWHEAADQATFSPPIVTMLRALDPYSSDTWMPGSPWTICISTPKDLPPVNIISAAR
jgi:hypothetical protein